MKLWSIAVLVFVLASAALCVRLGFWQLSRWEQKKAFNAGRRAAIEQPAIALEAPLPLLESIRDRRVEVRGAYDESRQILLTGRGYQGEMGVHLVTPLLLPGDSMAVLIERGWIPGVDITRVRPSDFPAPGLRAVLGMAIAIEQTKPGPPMRVAGSGSDRVFSMRSLHLDSLASRFSCLIAPYVVRELPQEGNRAHPIRLEPEYLDPSTNLSYSVQWFVFSAIILVGAAALGWSRRRAARRFA